MFDGMSVTPLNTSTLLTPVRFKPVALPFVLTLQKDFCRQTIATQQSDSLQIRVPTRSAATAKHTTTHHIPVMDPYERRDRSPLHACTIKSLDGTGQTVLNQ